MIDIYTEKKESKDWIIQNDLYFNLNTGNEEMTQNEKELIQQVDEVYFIFSHFFITCIQIEIQVILKNPIF